MNELKKVSKGSIAMVHGWWFVVVEQHGDNLFCICDNANNVYNYKIDECEYIASAYDTMQAHGWGSGDERLLELQAERSIPVEVIAEVLSGCHDDRFVSSG